MARDIQTWTEEGEGGLSQGREDKQHARGGEKERKRKTDTKEEKAKEYIKTQVATKRQ